MTCRSASRTSGSPPASTRTTFADAKMAAVRAHATQIPTDSWLFTLAEGFGREFLGVEYYELVVGTRGPGDGPNGWETDLFAGLGIT